MSSPHRIQGNSQEKWYWQMNEWMNERGTEERKRLIFLGLHRKPIKPWDKKLTLFTEATGALPVSRGSEDAEHLPVQVLETQADRWMQRASMLQGISLKKRVREKKKERKKTDMGWPSFFERGLLLYFQRGFYTLSCTLSKVKNAEATQHSISINFYWYQVLFCKSLIFCSSSSGPEAC